MEDRATRYQRQIDVVYLRFKAFQSTLQTFTASINVVGKNVAEIASNIHLHAEESYGDYRSTLHDVSTTLTGMEKEYDALDSRMQAVVSADVMRIEGRYNEIKQLIKVFKNTVKKEQTKKKSYESIQKKVSRELTKVKQTRAEYEGAKQEKEDIEQQLVEQIAEFERDKTSITKHVFGEFAHSMLGLSSKSIEHYTNIWNLLDSIEIPEVQTGELEKNEDEGDTGEAGEEEDDDDDDEEEEEEKPAPKPKRKARKGKKKRTSKK
eukprot:TRINITY_DN8481_c0_g1_i1.p2 TRINITY_DN8481_c0_g1~~TRINITY_DN8481_c0_g1_i1.p2  ORF type:complete len:294 (-),score=94.54 TRINITY_DN8481_c0_g1_i1:1191-1982(-)